MKIWRTWDVTWKIQRVSKVASDGTAFWLSGRADRPLVALIHGLGLCHKVWDGMLPALEADYHVLNYDLYGHGDSAPPPQTASLAVYAQQLAGILDHIDVPQAHVVGFSIGGMINRRFAMDFPARSQSLCILNSPHDRGSEAQSLVEARTKSVRDQGAFSTFDAALKRWFTPACLASDTPAPKLVRDWRGLVDGESYAQAAWVLANGVVELTGRQYDLPALVLTCENDSGSTPAMSMAIAAEFEDAQTVIVPELQHLGLMEQPDVFSAPVLEFLRKVS